MMEMDKTDKHQALVKAKNILRPTTQKSIPTMKRTAINSAAAEFTIYQKSIKTHKESQAYCTSRSLDWQKLAIGYKSRTPIPIVIGIGAEKSAQGKADRWGRGCLIFPLKDADGQVVSLYGRSIKGDNHYYQTGRRGLYPAYPDADHQAIALNRVCNRCSVFTCS